MSGCGDEPGRTCGSCRFHDEATGTCRAGAPVVLVVPGPVRSFGRRQTFGPAEAETYWPAVSAGDWCGQYRRTYERTVGGDIPPAPAEGC